MEEWARNEHDLSREVKAHPSLRSFFTNLQNVALRSKENGGLDDYALALTKQGGAAAEEQLLQLKSVLSCWLVMIQSGGNLEWRHQSFFTTIARTSPSKEHGFDPNINILSWNYDLQPEIACHKLFPDVPISTIPLMLGAPPFEEGSDHRVNTRRFFIVRMNGCAGSHRIVKREINQNTLTRMQDFVHSSPVDGIQGALSLYKRYTEDRDLEPGINFAWEKKSAWRRLFSGQILPVLKDTSHLIIIGYSFPPVNREVDVEILRAMKPGKVIVQDKNPTLITARIEDMVTTRWGAMIGDLVEPQVIPEKVIPKFEIRGIELTHDGPLER
jgi:hypothetical protein